MEKEFIPYEQALALKELGFNESCMYIFDKQRNNLMCPIYGLFENEEPNRFLNAPLYQQAFRWFRENHNLHLTLHLNSKGYFTTITEKINNLTPCTFSSEIFKAPEEAELECLKKLIEIVKEK